MDRKVIVMRKDGFSHCSTLNVSVVACLLFYQYFNAYSPFFTQMTNYRLLLRLDLYVCLMFCIVYVNV